MTSDLATKVASPGPTAALELRAERLGFALQALAAELVEERRRVALLSKQIERLQAELEHARMPGGVDRRRSARQL